MLIKHLTLTGADDNVDPVELAKLSKQYPFIEWAILISEQREGTSRYPSKEWRHEFYKACHNTYNALHICGQEMLNQLEAQRDEFASELQQYQRIQLNFNANRTDAKLINSILNKAMRGSYLTKYGEQTQLITQYNQNNAEITHEICEKYHAQPSNHGILFDASGGLGLSPDTWQKPFPNKHCGYAGGLGPDNILKELSTIDGLIEQQPDGSEQTIWIDMETKLRTNDEFDLSKANDVADKVKKWLTGRRY